MSSTIQCKCKNCGELFTARVADRKRGWARFCSKSCKAIRQEKQTGQYNDHLRRSNQDDGLCFPSHAEGDVQ